MKIHEPVLLKEVLENIITDRKGVYVDATIGFGGHSSEILKLLDSDAKFIGIDQDLEAFKFCKEKFSFDSRVSLYHSRFNNLNIIRKIEFIDKFDGILADLGVSSFQLDNTEAGFTFRQDTKLDLRMNRTEGKTAADFLNEADEKEIADVIYRYGEEKKSRQIARKIVEKRKKTKVSTTFQLRDIIAELVPEFYLVKSLTRVFQALRIHVNDEFNTIKSFLEQSVDNLRVGGRIGVITFHSLEDKIVKDYFKYETMDCICDPRIPVCQCNKEKRLKLVNKKPIIASDEELKNNKRARSAKLRVAERI